MALIDLSNFVSTLCQSTNGRAGNINGNIFFDTTGKIEFLPASEAAFVNLTRAGTPTGTAAVVATGMVNTTYYEIVTIGTTDFTLIGAASNTVGLVFQATGAGTGTGTGDECTANPLISADGLKFEAIYSFENQERAVDEALRKFDRWTSGTFKFGGAYNFVNDNVPSTTADRTIIRGSGWNELNSSGVPIKKYFGMKGLSNIEVASQPYNQQAIQGTATDFLEVGQIDEAILVYHDSNGDGTPDTVNLTTYAAVSIRTYGKTHDRKETTTDLGLAELGGYSTGVALNESVHLTTNSTDHPIASVYNSTRASQTGVWLNMALNHIAAPSVKSGEFSDETGSRLFSWELLNANSANLDQCVAWLDAFALNTDEADELAVNTGHLGKDIETWYSYNASGQIVTKSGVTPASEGMYINNVPTADQQRVVMTDDGNTVKAYSFSVSVEAEVGATAKGDVNAWYHSWFADAGAGKVFNSTLAEVVKDSAAAEVKGLASAADVNNKVIFAFDYTGDTNGGTADTDKDCVFLCEGDGGATQAKTLYTIVKLTTVAFTCSPAVENNA